MEKYKKIILEQFKFLISMIIYMKYIICIMLLFFVYDFALARSNNFIVQNYETAEKDTLNNIVGHTRNLIKKTSPTRYQFETLDSFNARIEQYNNELAKHLQKKYSLSFSCQNVKLDWENSSVIISENFIIPILRKRGGGGQDLRIVIPLTPDKARLIVTFPEQLVVTVFFSIDKYVQMQVSSISIMNRGELIYEE